MQPGNNQLSMIVLMTPDMANFSGNVHGGTLLKYLDEVAYACASRYAGRYVVTLSVDQVIFREPVHVGELVTFLASVNYTDVYKRQPQSVALAERARRALFDGVPMHWMSDWSTPCPLFVARAHGARFHDVDGHAYVDFCLGDTGSMFGHSPAPIARALAEQGANGLTTMLPGEDAIVAGELLAQRFGLPFWQVATTATDANRFVLRWARAITGRKAVSYTHLVRWCG